MSGYLTNTAANSENLNAIRESIDAIDLEATLIAEMDAAEAEGYPRSE